MKEKRRLSQYREAKGYSQIDIADRLSVTQQSISSWEIGRTVPKPYQMKQLSEILEVSIDELFYEIFNMKK
ncbi:helix-turn-helix transcriptional regulator [Vagococcus fluvialis]|uniref:helix-turn-helix transcriptional regulator n=1 Tax=Vagococcus fluvialis TaxID=2738 RepID=UPI001A8C3192|nr:helix-turn-helix transcriptional regulator [Vagococcus fluvialis]MBO0480174.1 helix-turn-helix transcriptional regulator [Vagococcus fluvialis]MBO0483939.1 helix-turn-helix transcriptional regulator [Vagococcus fluvialis]